MANEFGIGRFGKTTKREAGLPKPAGCSLAGGSDRGSLGQRCDTGAAGSLRLLAAISNAVWEVPPEVPRSKMVNW
jgi:hypothetical protein